ncbi:hypothetical protein C0J52_24328 [Blattella germanica]|nr:hypothetical protein C0J52_24328 [Blattella germanica]
MSLSNLPYGAGAKRMRSDLPRPAGYKNRSERKSVRRQDHTVIVTSASGTERLYGANSECCAQEFNHGKSDDEIPVLCKSKTNCKYRPTLSKYWLRIT